MLSAGRPQQTIRSIGFVSRITLGSSHGNEAQGFGCCCRFVGLELHALFNCALRQDSERHSILFEAWLNCSGNWKASQLFLNAKSSYRTRKKGTRVWMFRWEVESKFGKEAAYAIIQRKLADETLRTTEVRRHPELPESCSS